MLHADGNGGGDGGASRNGTQVAQDAQSDPYGGGMVYVKQANSRKAMLTPLQQLNVGDQPASCGQGALPASSGRLPDLLPHWMDCPARVGITACD